MKIKRSEAAVWNSETKMRLRPRQGAEREGWIVSGRTPSGRGGRRSDGAKPRTRTVDLRLDRKGFYTAVGLAALSSACTITNVVIDVFDVVIEGLPG